MSRLLDKIVSTQIDRSIIFIRLSVGLVFLSEGIQKFLYPNLRGTGRFMKIGLPIPEFLGPLVGAFEIASGTMILLGLMTRLAAIPTTLIMLVAFATTKTTLYANEGFWGMMHGSRTDWAMLLGSLFLISKGGGSCSLDQKIHEAIARDQS